VALLAVLALATVSCLTRQVSSVWQIQSNDELKGDGGAVDSKNERL